MKNFTNAQRAAVGVFAATLAVLAITFLYLPVTMVVDGTTVTCGSVFDPAYDHPEWGGYAARCGSVVNEDVALAAVLVVAGAASVIVRSFTSSRQANR